MFIFERLCNLIFPVSIVHCDVIITWFLVMFVVTENLTPSMKRECVQVSLRGKLGLLEVSEPSSFILDVLV